MRRILSVIIAVCMIVSAFLLASCGDKKKDDKKDDPTHTGLDISEYSIIRSDKSGAAFAKYVSNFHSMIEEYTGKSLTVKFDGDYDPEPKEILLGNTNRTESTEAFAQLNEDNRFVIKMVNGKIVIAGKTEETTARAIKVFLDSCVKTSKGDGYIDIEEGYSNNGVANLDSILFDNFTEFYHEYTSDIMVPSLSAVGVIQYTKVTELLDGTLLATYENYSGGCNIYRSTDNGKTWEYCSKVTDTLNSGFEGELMPHLYTLPVDMGEYKAGTAILAGTSSTAYDPITETKITLHASTDKGETWNTICNVDVGGWSNEGVWEPFLVYEEKRGRLYCFYSDDSDPEYSQSLVYKYTTDLKNWHGVNDEVGVEVEPKLAVACPNKSWRPGMISIADMGEGGYIMTYEMMASGIPDVQAYYKKTMDLDDWGDPADYGKPVAAPGNNSFGSSPWCAWTPEGGGKCGTLVVIGRHPVPFYSTGKGAKMLLSFDYGETFIAIDNPIPYNVEKSGYSPCVVFSHDGKTLYYTNNPLFGLGTCQKVVMAKIKIW
ncbi:MAG: exo-alpha-sialidase [Clostridia bacterium]|nr:exo-alpha-sialidase [Clostridia bacterium]